MCNPHRIHRLGRIGLSFAAILALTVTTLPAADALAPIAADAEAVAPLAVGAALPDAPLETLDGSATSLRRAVVGEPTVLVVFRGGWCPFCIRHLRALAEEREAIAAAGYRVIGVSPDSPESLAKAAEAGGDATVIYSDPEFAASRALGLAFTLDEATVSKYREYGIPLRTPEGADDDAYALPVPAVIVVDATGRVRFVHFDPDYRERLAPEDLLAALAAD